MGCCCTITVVLLRPPQLHMPWHPHPPPPMPILHVHLPLHPHPSKSPAAAPINPPVMAPSKPSTRPPIRAPCNAYIQLIGGRRNVFFALRGVLVTVRPLLLRLILCWKSFGSVPSPSKQQIKGWPHRPSALYLLYLVPLSPVESPNNKFFVSYTLCL